MNIVNILSPIFIIITSYLICSEIVELLFYSSRGWDFNVDNKYSGTTFDADGPQAYYRQSNRDRVLIGRPIMIFGFLMSAIFLSIY
ncbi:hypothetical protein PDO_5231 [Rhizobium sp. PDO1-076]|nr:hypothetical protein PDO_5231 [Rhizobium sp. PDO1-076]